MSTIEPPDTYHRSPLLWRVWFHFVFMPVTRFIGRLPVAEWRREMWVYRLDCWAMDQFRRWRPK